MSESLRITRNLETKEGRAFWRHVDKVAAEVDTWPPWMRGAYYQDKKGKWRAVPVRKKKTMSYTDEQKEKLYEACVKKWGPQSQAILAMEESAEFIKAMSKHLRFNTQETQDALAEELCDMRLMLNQIERAYGLRRKAAAAEVWKLQRLEKRLEE